jgi:hypothetical protein
MNAQQAATERAQATLPEAIQSARVKAAAFNPARGVFVIHCEHGCSFQPAESSEVLLNHAAEIVGVRSLEGTK